MSPPAPLNKIADLECTYEKFVNLSVLAYMEYADFQ